MAIIKIIVLMSPETVRKDLVECYYDSTSNISFKELIIPYVSFKDQRNLLPGGLHVILMMSCWQQLAHLFFVCFPLQASPSPLSKNRNEK